MNINRISHQKTLDWLLQIKVSEIIVIWKQIRHLGLQHNLQGWILRKKSWAVPVVGALPSLYVCGKVNMCLREWLEWHQIIRKWICIISDCITDVCVLSFMYLFSPPALHELCAARWKWNKSSSPTFALSQSQGRSFWERKNLSVIDPRPPECSSFSFLCAEVALSILIVACMIRIIIYSFCEVISPRLRCIQNPEGAAFSHNVPFFPVFYSLLPLVLRDRFCGLYIPIPENFPAVEWIPNAGWPALLSRFS